MKALSRLAFLLAAMMTAGCTHLSMRGHVAASDYTANPTRIYVLNGLDERFSPAMPQQFNDAFTAAIAPCGVSTAAYRASGLQLNVGSTIEAQLKEFGADAVLVIRQTERVYYEGQVVRMAYVATLNDVAQKREVWKADFTMGGGAFADKSGLGPRLANMIVRRLGEDKIVKTCTSLPAAS
jgi:hypothetical protein